MMPLASLGDPIVDNAVALVQAYLRVNGYLTVTEYPIVEALPDTHGGFQAATDLDVLGFRFGHSCNLVTQRGQRIDGAACEVDTDPALGVQPGVPDMIIGEVKEGRAVLNRAATSEHVLAAAVTRFGCCEPAEAVRMAQELVGKGHARTQHGHRVRLISFGSLPPDVPPHAARRYEVVLLGDIVRFLRAHVRRHWSRLQASESKDPALSFLMTLEKAERGGRGGAAQRLDPPPNRAGHASLPAQKRLGQEGGRSHA